MVFITVVKPSKHSHPNTLPTSWRSGVVHSQPRGCRCNRPGFASANAGRFGFGDAIASEQVFYQHIIVHRIMQDRFDFAKVFVDGTESKLFVVAVDLVVFEKVV